MALAQTVNGDLLVTGNIRMGSLTVPGTINGTIGRSTLTQDDLAAEPLPLHLAVVHDAITSRLPNPSANDDLGIYGSTTYGTNSLYLATYDVKTAGAVTLYARWPYVVLPDNYQAGQTVNVRFYAGMITTVADVSATIDLQCYKSDGEAGVDGGDLCATSAQSINSLTFSNIDFTITPTSLAAGDVLDLRVAIAVNDAETGTAVIGAIGKAFLLRDVKG